MGEASQQKILSLLSDHDGKDTQIHVMP